MESNSKGKMVKGESRITAHLALAVVAAVLGPFQFGYNTGVINAPQTVIESFINKTYYDRTKSPMSKDLQTFLWGFTVAIMAGGGMIGGFIGGPWATRFGRKKGMMINAGLGTVAAVLMGLCKVAKTFEMLIVGRFVVGFVCGLYTALGPMYLTEIASKNLRGALGTFNQFGVVCGLLIAQVFGIPDALGTDELWPLLLGFSGVASVLQLALLPFCPESPRYLLLTKQDEAGARAVLEKLRGTKNTDSDVEEMKQEAAAEASEEHLSVPQLLRRPGLRLPLLICIIMQLSQQLSGINAVFYYSTTLFEQASVPRYMATYATMGVGGTMVAVTTISIFLIDRAGRRTLHLIGLGGMFVFSIAITVALALQHLVSWFSYINIACAFTYVAFFGIGPGSIPWMITAEMFSHGARPAAISVAVLVNWSANLLVGQLFPFMQKGLGDYTFLPFTALLLVSWIFTYFLVPETKGKTIEEISAMFRKRHETSTGYAADSNASGPDTKGYGATNGAPRDRSKLINTPADTKENHV